MGLYKYDLTKKNKHDVDMQKLISMLLVKYPDTDAIFLCGSFIRDDGIPVQDIDVMLVSSGNIDDRSPNGESMLYNTKIDINSVTARTLENIEDLLNDSYYAGLYNDSMILYDKTGIYEDYLLNFKNNFPKPQYLKNRTDKLSEHLTRQFNKVIAACETDDEIEISSKFYDYCWVLCDAVNVRNSQSPSWIRGLHKIGRYDKKTACSIIEAEGHSDLTKEDLLSVFHLFSELWDNLYFDYNKKELEWLICNNFEAEAFHSLNICIMMGIKNRNNDKALFNSYCDIVGRKKILPLKSVEGFKKFHNDMIEYLKL